MRKATVLAFARDMGGAMVIGRTAHELERRGHAVALVRKYDQEFPKKYFKEFLEYVDIDEGTFWKLIDAGRSPHLWEKKGSEWALKHQVT